MTAKNVIQTLNEFLQGQYMGIHAYEHHIEKLEDPNVKKEFQQIQQDHKLHAQKVAERIQNLGEHRWMMRGYWDLFRAF